MRVKEFNKIIKNKKPEEIIRMYYECEISLTNKQLNKVIEIKNATIRRK